LPRLKRRNVSLRSSPRLRGEDVRRTDEGRRDLATPACLGEDRVFQKLSYVHTRYCQYGSRATCSSLNLMARSTPKMITTNPPDDRMRTAAPHPALRATFSPKTGERGSCRD